MAELKQYEYYRSDLGVLYCGDCMKIMPLFPDDYFDLCLTDPPYGINIAKKGTVGFSIKADLKEYIKSNWDSKPPNKDNFDYCHSTIRPRLWGFPVPMSGQILSGNISLLLLKTESRRLSATTH